jgi:predicted GNAT family N-acyltransferase
MRPGGRRVEERTMTSGDRIVCRRVDVATILPLRHRVLRRGRPAETARFDGDEADTTRHYAAVLDGEAIACLTLVAAAWEGHDAWQLRGMATDDRHRRTGIGSALLSHALADVDTVTPGRPMWCNARIEVAVFYRHPGWSIVSAPFDIAGIGPHVRMERHARSDTPNP